MIDSRLIRAVVLAIAVAATGGLARAAEGGPPPYQADLQRLAEILGALHYLRGICGEDFTAKDFRTWAGTVLAAQSLAETGHADGVKKSKREIVTAVDLVAKRLGNTRSVCRKCYIHPAVIDAWIDGSLAKYFANRKGLEKRKPATSHPSLRTGEEAYRR